MLAGSPLYCGTLACIYCSVTVWVDVCTVGQVCQGGIKKQQKKTFQSKLLACMLSVFCIQTHSGDWVHSWNSFCTQKVSYGSYHMLILCERAPINTHVCITPPCVCACLRKPRQTRGTAQAVWAVCVLTLSGRPLLWRPRSGGLTRRPRCMCVFELGM